MNIDIITYLRELKNRFSYDKTVTVVMGNEAADLDSIVSAVCYAWYLYSCNGTVNSFPLINIPREDFRLRTEAVYLFKEAGINIDTLLFTDNLDLVKLKEEGRLKLILVDHNKLAANQLELKENIAAVLDHHTDENLYPPGTITDIRPVGSAATLVAEAVLQKRNIFFDNSLGTLLLGAILLDTVNLDPVAGRVTNYDIRAAEEILKITGLDRYKLFKKLQFEKFNVSSLSTYDLLRKDYKEWKLGGINLGIGSVLISIEDWVEKDPEIAMACEHFLKERKLDVLLVMIAFSSLEFTRQLVLYIPEYVLRDRVVSFLEISDLGLEKFTTKVSGEDLFFYNQKNHRISRKKLQPLLKEFFER